MTRLLGTRARRRDLLAALVAAQGWLDDAEFGPTSVDAGSCDRCARAPRLVAPCGPVPWRGVCRDCLLQVGPAAFCPGHEAFAVDVTARARALPPTWATLARLTWVARGEMDADPAFLAEAVDVLRDVDAPVRSIAPTDRG